MTLTAGSPVIPVFGAATKVGFTTQPGNGTGGSDLSTQPVVAVQDAGGNTVTTATNSITLAIGTNPSGGTLSVTTNPVTAVNGVATFAGIKINLVGTGYTLTATPSGGLTAATSTAFNITVGAASQVAFTQQPGGSSVTGGVFPTQPKVTVEDTGGNTVTGSSASIVLSITSGTGTAGATLICTGTGTNGTTFAASSGVATATGCKIDKAGTGYKLHATSGTLTAADSSRQLRHHLQHGQLHDQHQAGIRDPECVGEDLRQ